MSEGTRQLVENFAREVSGGSQDTYELIMNCLPDDVYDLPKEEIEILFKEMDIETIKKMASSIEKNNTQKADDTIQNEDNNDNINEDTQNETIQQNNISNDKNDINDNKTYDNISDLIMQRSFGYSGICRIIPQRPPFLMIDKVINLDIKNKIAICQKCVSANEGFFAGHFPNNPIMPGVLMVEAMAQTASIIGKALMNGKRGTLLFASADNVKFNGIATAGDVLTIEAQVTKIRDPLVIGECRVKKQDEIICSCILKAFRKEI